MKDSTRERERSLRRLNPPTALLLSLSGVSGLVGCMPTFDDDVTRIDSSRVLAIRSDPAEAAPGQEVTLTVFEVSPDNQDHAEVSLSFCTARKPSTELGPVAQQCVSDESEGLEILVPLGDGPRVEATLASDVCRIFGPLAPSIAGSDGGVGRPADPDLTGGYYQPVVATEETNESSTSGAALGTVRLLCGGSLLPQEELVVFNRGYRPNVHPEVRTAWVTINGSRQELDLESLGEALEVPVDSEVTFELRWDACPVESDCGDGLCTAGENAGDCPADCRDAPVGCSGAEVFLVADPETRTVQQQPERVEVSWFATGGTFDSAITDNAAETTQSSNVWVAPASSGTVQLWTVVRDSRRGVSWESVTLRVTN